MEAPSKPGAAQEVPIRSGGANMVTPAEGAVAAGEEEGDPIVAMVMRAMQSDNIDATLYMLVRATFEVFPKVRRCVPSYREPRARFALAAFALRSVCPTTW